MSRQPLPRDVKQALHRLDDEPGRAWTTRALAEACGVAPRTLQKHFRRFLGRAPLRYAHDLRFDRARQELLRSPRGSSVTEIATRLGFSHLGRFAAEYRRRYGETPSATLMRSRSDVHEQPPRVAPLPIAIERPSIAVLPFVLAGADAHRFAGMAEDIAASLLRLRWLRIVGPAAAQYQLRGVIRSDGGPLLRATVVLVEAASGRALWADRWEGNSGDAFGFIDRAAARITRAVGPAMRNAEIDRASREDPARRSAWALTMRALPLVLGSAADAQGLALELLEQAMELAPKDPLPMALASWCRGLRGCVHLAPRRDEEMRAARELAASAAALRTGDALTEALLAAGYAMAHDLPRAAIHVERALDIDGGSAWAWGRGGLVSLFNGKTEEALERLRIARGLASGDPMNSFFSAGIGTAHLQDARFDEAILWLSHAIAESPTAIWINFLLTSSYALASRREEARRSLAEWSRTYPDVTISEIRTGMPFSTQLLDRISEGLESAGMRGGR